MNVQTIDRLDQIEALCVRIGGAQRVGLDTEFHNERSYAARLMVVQLAFDDGCAIVDPLSIADLQPVARALCERTLVGHALGSDLKIFADKFDCLPVDVFDCQVAAAFLGYGMSISLADLVRDVTGLRLKKSQTVSDWSTRPLTEHQIEYLIDDVAYLLPMQDRLSQRLRDAGRYEWAAQESAQLTGVERYRPNQRRLYMRIPGASRMNRRELGVLSELAALRNEIASRRDLPLKYIIPDDVMAGIVSLRPRRVEELAQLRRLDAGTRKSLGSQIVDAVLRGEALSEDQLPEKTVRPLGNSRETVAALMSVVVGEIAKQHELPTSLLAPRAALERVAREVPPTREAFEVTLGLSDWRAQLVAEPLWRLLSGSGALRIEGYSNGDPRIRYE